MARIAHVQGLRGCLYTLRCFHIPTDRFHATVSAGNGPKVSPSLGQRWASGCLGMAPSCSSTSENNAVIQSTVIMGSSVPRWVARFQPAWRKCMPMTTRPASTIVLIGLQATNTIGYYDGPPTPALPPVRGSPALRCGASLPRVLPPIRHLASASFSSLLGAFPHRGASHFGVCSGSGLGGFGSGLPWPPHRSPSHPVQGFPCPLRWTLQRGVGGGSLLIPTALCGSQPGGR